VPYYESLSDHLEDIGLLADWRAAVEVKDVNRMDQILRSAGYDDPSPYIENALRWGLHNWRDLDKSNGTSNPDDLPKP
jgi:hypothetical protein